jgi:hypothetical protein
MRRAIPATKSPSSILPIGASRVQSMPAPAPTGLPGRGNSLCFSLPIGTQVPPNAQEDDRVFEVSPPEERWPFSVHDTPYQISLNRVCNRTRDLEDSLAVSEKYLAK